MFSQVFVCSQGGSAYNGGGGLLWGGVGQTSPGLPMGRGSASEGGGVGQIPLRYMGYYRIRSTSGRYASYLNAFLLIIRQLDPVQLYHKLN